MAKSSAHTILQFGDGSTPEAYRSLGQMTALTGPSISREMSDITDLDDDWRQQQGHLADGAEVTATILLDPDVAAHETVIEEVAAADPSRAWRIIWPPYDIETVAIDSIATATEVLTMASAHGWQTGQPVQFSTIGTAPTSSPQVAAGTVYYARREGASTLTLYDTAAHAYAGGATGRIDFAAAGSANELGTGKEWTFAAVARLAAQSAAGNEPMAAEITLRVAGEVTT
jgi:hypothetical protein